MNRLLLVLLLLGCGMKKPTTEPCTDPLACVDGAGEACTDCDSTCILDFLPTEDRTHVDEEVQYADTPPTGGEHHSCWADWGIYTEELADERWVHNLEHGGIVFVYNCPEGCEDEVAALAETISALPVTILSPYSQMDFRWAVIAWENRQLMQCFDPIAMRAFYDAHVDRAPESTSSMSPAGCDDEDTGHSHDDTGDSTTGS